jgi:hypothetical protein
MRTPRLLSLLSSVKGQGSGGRLYPLDDLPTEQAVRAENEEY